MSLSLSPFLRQTQTRPNDRCPSLPPSARPTRPTQTQKTTPLLLLSQISVHDVMTGRSYSGGFILVASTVVVCLILVLILTWDVSCKATYSVSRDDADGGGDVHESCKGGIYWHGVAVRSSASQVRFKLLEQLVTYNSS